MLANPATLGMMNDDNNVVFYLKFYIYIIIILLFESNLLCGVTNDREKRNKRT